MKQRIAVVSGSNYGDSNTEQEACENLGLALASSNRQLIYDGHEGGLINLLVENFQKKNGYSYGVFCSETAHNYTLNENLSKTETVDRLEEQTNKIIDLADSFIFLPNFSLHSLNILYYLIFRSAVNLNNKPIAFLSSEAKMDLVIKQLEVSLSLTNDDHSFLDTILFDINPYSLLNKIDQFRDLKQNHHK